jgi:NAD(P)-dependent dehydrogenase (short-subunit alcohol dehydrogenase family)
LEGRVALVAGVPAPMAAQLVRDLTGEGGRVAVAGATGAGLDELVAALDGRAVHVADAPPGDEEGARALVGAVEAALGPATIVVHGAATAPMARGAPAGLADLSLDGWQQGLSALDRSFLLVKATAPAMIAASFGRHVLLGSSSVHTGRPPGAVVEATATAGLDGVARTVAQELGHHGITANVLIAGPAGPTGPTGGNVLGRPVDDAEVSAMCVHLCSGPGGATTGARVLVDGGAMER